MPDISMCINKDCNLSNMCYRFLATPSEPQSYTEFKPNNDGTCDNFKERGEIGSGIGHQVNECSQCGVKLTDNNIYSTKLSICIKCSDN